MKIFRASKKDIFSCDYCYECDRKLGKNEIGILIGEGSDRFEEDTAQAFVCINCLKRAVDKIEEYEKL